MTPYLTAQAAATRLGKSEKTVRRWIAEGRLVAHHPNGRKNMLAISEDDIEKLAQEEAQYKRTGQEQDTSSLEARIAQLEQRVTELEHIISVGTPAQPAAAETTRTRPRHASATYEPLEKAPPWSIPFYTFAKNHGVNDRTFKDHIKKGHVPAISRPIPNRKDQTAYSLSPEQQRAAIEFWKANGTPFHECTLCPHTDEVYQRAGQDQEETA